MQGRQDDSDGQADLIGYHLGLCDPAEAAKIEKAIGKDERMIQTRAKLARVLALLDADDAPAIPSHLNDAVLARVARLHRTLPMAAAAEMGGPSRPMFNLRELLSLAAVIAIFVGVFVPGYRTAKENARITTCANNLRQIGIGNQLYVENYGAQPFVAALPDGISWVPGDGQRPTNSQNPFELVKGHFVPPSAFNCPARDGDIPLMDPRSANLNDFPGWRNNSYSTNLVTDRVLWRQIEPESPIAADLTPLVDDERHLLRDQPISPNSTSHRGQGENVLKADVRVFFTRNPNVGLDNDDIYRVIGVQKYTGLERPQMRSDAFLVP